MEIPSRPFFHESASRSNKFSTIDREDWSRKKIAMQYNFVSLKKLTKMLNGILFPGDPHHWCDNILLVEINSWTGMIVASLIYFQGEMTA